MTKIEQLNEIRSLVREIGYRIKIGTATAADDALLERLERDIISIMKQPDDKVITNAST